MKSISKRFNLFGIIVVTIVALALFIRFDNAGKARIQEARNITILSRDLVGSEITNQLMKKAQVISDAADYISAKRWEDDEIIAYFKTLTNNNPTFSLIYLGKPNNEFINGSGWIPPKTFDLRTRPWYIKALAEDKLVFSEAFVNAAKEELIITIAKPVYASNGEFMGVVAGDVSIESILSIVQDKKISNNGYSFLIDGKGNILAHPYNDKDLSSKLRNIDEISKDANEQMHKNNKGLTRIILDGSEGYLAYQTIENTDWRIGSFVPLDDYMESKLQYLRMFAVTFISSILFFLIILILEKRYFINPAVSLDKDIRNINIEHDISYRIPIIKKDPFIALRQSINTVLNKTQEFLEKLDENEQELLANNEELTASLEQLAAAEEELRNHNDQLKISESKLRISENTFRVLFEDSTDAIFIVDNNRYLDCNPAAVKLFGFDTKEDIIGKSPWEFSPEKQPDGEYTKEKSLEIDRIAHERESFRFEWWLQKKDGALLPVEAMLTSITLNEKKVLHVLCRDINERKQLEQKLEYLSYHDQLTGLYNRRFLIEEFKRLDVKRNYPLTIVMADVNGLKLINDSFGHATGDELLVRTAEVIKKGCRADDIIARFGGDEFVILLPKTDGTETEKIVKRIQAICRNEKVASIELSVSFGWEAKLHETEDINDVFKKAEDYLYKRKLFESPSMRGKTIGAIMNTLHEKNKREEQHSHRVSALCDSMGRALGLPESEIQELKTVGLLHDIGKIAIDENILNKPGKLTADERDEIKRHPEIGYRILSSVNDMSEMAEYVLAHHERWDGGGYPKGLKGEEIPLQARIMAVADTYDAMTSERAYRGALPAEVALDELRRNAGTQFDPGLVNLFIEKVMKE